MKKSLVLMAVTSVALASCVNDVADVAQTNEQVKILFDKPVLYNSTESRANVHGEISSITENGVTYTYPKAENFIVYAISHENAFSSWSAGTVAAFNNKSISYDNNLDGWAPKTDEDKYYYWENGKMMSFAASSPADLEQTNWGAADKRSYGATGLKIEDYEILADAEHQYDLLFSTRVCNQTSANMNHSAGAYSGLPIVFQHALSSIRFSIANSSEDETVCLTGIKVKGVKYKGTFNENITENGETYDRNENGNVKPAWSVTNDIITTPYLAFEGNVEFLESPRYVSQLVAEAVEEGNTGNKCNQLLLMPQDLTDDAEVEVHYTVNGNANTKNVKLKGLMTTKEENGKTVNGVAIDSWEMGKRYTYRLYYSAETASKDKIYFAPSTEAWKDVDVIIVAL